MNSPIILFLLSIACIILTIIVTTSSVRDFWQEWRIFRQGIVTTGKITAIIKRDFWRQPRDKIYFRFTVVTDNEQRYTVAQQIYPKHLLDMQVNQEVEVKYFPATPKIARLSGMDADNFTLDMAIARVIVSTMAILSVPLTLMMTRP